MTDNANNAEDIFLAALDKGAPQERAAYVEGACAGRPELYRRVRELLGCHEESRGPLDAPPPGLGGSADESSMSERPETQIGPYKLLEVIGEGGMGVVWMAEQTQPVRRKVALKLIKPGMDSAQVVARFEVERQALALMDHPNIAQVLDAGATSSGRPYFVMELVKGVPVTRFCDANRLTPRQRLELFVSICRAVQHAHTKGIIHRDLKPGNVLVTLHDSTPVVKVIDFGIAKAMGPPLTDKTQFTGFAQLLGTPLYMSPEQAEMNGLDVDTRSDVYALGVLLYELLTGTTPFTSARLRAAGYDEMRRIIREEEPARPSLRISTLGELLTAVSAQRQTDPKRLSQLFRGEVDWIVMKALEKDRGRRYETASALAADVLFYLHDEPVQACPPSASYRLWKFVRRNKGRLGVAAGVFLAVTVMAASIGWAVRDRVARQAEIEQAETARQATVAGQVRDSLNTARTLIAENKLASAREKLAQARAQLGNDWSALGHLAAEVEAGEAELNRFQQFLDLIDRAHQAETAPLLEVTLAADGSPSSAGTPAPARTWEWRPAAAVPFLLEALQRYDILERDDWNSTLEGGLLGRQQVEHIRRLAYEELLWLATDVVRRQQEHRSEQKLSPQAAAREALVYLGKAESAHRPTQALYALRARCRKALGEETAAQADTQLADQTPPTMALDHSLRGQAAYDAKQLAEAAQAFEAALLLEPTHYWSLMRLGACLCDLGQGPEDFIGAARVFTGCILKRPDQAHAYFCRANAYSNLRRYKEAVADSSRAIELDPKFAFAWNTRGCAYDELGQLDKAVADFSKAIELDPKYALTWYNRGTIYNKLGQPDKALTDFSRAIELDPKFAPAWHNRGWAYNELGQPDEAVADCSKAIELDPKYPPAWNNRGVAYIKLSQLDKALNDLTRAIELDPKYALAWSNRGGAYDQVGQLDKAVADYSKAVELNPKYALAWMNRGIAYDKLGQPDKALADFSKAVESDPKYAPAWMNRGVFYHGLDQPEKALTDYSRAIDLDPKYAHAWYNRGMTYNQLGQPEKALTDFSRAIELDPKNPRPWINRGNTYHGLGQPDKALTDYSGAIELDPKYALAWHHRGATYLKLGRPDKAVADCSKAIELAPNQLELCQAYLLRAEANCRLAHFEQARTDYQAAVKRAPPDHAGTHNGLAWLLAACPDAKLGDPDQAVELAKKAVQLGPKVGNYWKTLGVAHYRAGDWKAAVAALDKSRELRQGGDAVDRLFLAMAHRKLGNPDEARKAYEQALQWLEKNQEALEKDKGLAEELRRFRAEAEEVLELKKQ